MGMLEKGGAERAEGGRGGEDDEEDELDELEAQERRVARHFGEEEREPLGR